MDLDWKWKGALCDGEITPGIVAAQPAVPVEVAPGRWLNVYGLLDGRGHDSCCGLLGELRQDAPDGLLLQRKILVQGGDDYSPFDDGQAYFRCVGQPSVFGSSKTGVFVICFYVYAHQFIKGILENPGSGHWKGRPNTLQDSLRLFQIQIKYLPDQNDWDIVVPMEQLRERGYEKGDAFCSLGEGRLMNHSLQPPAPLDKDGMAFVELATLTHKRDQQIGGHGTIAPILWQYLPKEGRYIWTKTGAPWQVPPLCGEAATIAMPDGTFLSSLRQFRTGNIILTRTTDLFHGPDTLQNHSGTSAPRTIFFCRDKVIRLFTNFSQLSPYRHERNPLYELTISENLRLSSPRVIGDAVAQEISWEEPFVDMGKYVEAADGRSLLLMRTIARVQTVGNANMPPLSLQERRKQGVYYLQTNWR